MAPVDSEITIAIPFIRFTTFFKKYRIQRFQHLYTPFLYLFFTMNLIILRDFSDVRILPKKNSQQVVKRFSPGFYLVFFSSKIFYFGFALVIPLLVQDFVWWKVVIGFFTVHALMSVFDMPYQSMSWAEGMQSHFRRLKELALAA